MSGPAVIPDVPAPDFDTSAIGFGVVFELPVQKTARHAYLVFRMVRNADGDVLKAGQKPRRDWSDARPVDNILKSRPESY